MKQLLTFIAIAGTLTVTAQTKDSVKPKSLILEGDERFINNLYQSLDVLKLFYQTANAPYASIQTVERLQEHIRYQIGFQTQTKQLPTKEQPKK